jgi:polyisoprenoid-binding protein YceI
MRISIFVFLLLGITETFFAQTAGELILFVQEDQKVSQQLLAEDLAAIEKVAAGQNVTLKVVNLKGEAPEFISFTPALVFQNHLGRSVFRGRYKALGRLTNFVRAAQWEPQEATDYQKKNIMYLRRGKSVLASPVKITALSGTIPKGFSASEFDEEARSGLIKGMSEFEYKKEMTLPAAARLFYMDFYPYRDKKGGLFVKLRVYSMFNCVEQVYESESSLYNKSGNVSALFEQAGRQMEEAVLAELNNPKYGDGIEPILNSLSVASFESLGLPLPEYTGEEKLKPNYGDLKTVDYWAFEKPVLESLPALQFQFPSPLDHYAGEAKKVDAYFDVPDIRTLKGIKGEIFVATKSITMGDAALDDHVFHSYLKTEQHPVSSYRFVIVDAPNKLIPGEVQRIELEGDFEMNGKKVKLPAVGTVELIANEKGEPRLHVTGQFNLALRELYGIKGPDGPKEASDNLKFKLNFLMRPPLELVEAEKFETLARTIKPVLAGATTIEPETKNTNETGTIKWRASTKMYKAEGNFTEWNFTKLNIPNGDMEKIEADLEIDLASITEKSSLLVKHVKSDKFLDVEVYPYARIKIRGAKKNSNNTYTGEAVLEMKEVKAPVSFVFEVLSESPLRVRGTCEISRKVFNVGKVKERGGVSELVEVELEVDLEPDER